MTDVLPAGAHLQRARDIRDQLLRGDMMIGIVGPGAIDEMKQHYWSAAEGGETIAWLELGEVHYQGIEVPVNDAIARDHWRRGFEAGDRACGLRLVQASLFGTQSDEDETKAIVEDLLDDDPDGSAALLAGYMHTRGFGFPQDDAKALELHHRAAERGNGDALFELYVFYSTGRGTEQDEERAVDYCRQAADQGKVRAMYNMGAFHATGRGVAQSWTECVAWYEKAARAGHPNAAGALAQMYETGAGVTKDGEKAAHWWEIAEELGYGY